MSPGAVATMTPPRRDATPQDPGTAHNSVNAHNTDALYEHAKQLYSRLKKLRGKYRDLERKHMVLKSIYIRVKHEEMKIKQLSKPQTPNQVLINSAAGRGAADGTLLHR